MYLEDLSFLVLTRENHRVGEVGVDTTSVLWTGKDIIHKSQKNDLDCPHHVGLRLVCEGLDCVGTRNHLGNINVSVLRRRSSVVPLKSRVNLTVTEWIKG